MSYFAKYRIGLYYRFKVKVEPYYHLHNFKLCSTISLQTLGGGLVDGIISNYAKEKSDSK